MSDVQIAVLPAGPRSRPRAEKWLPGGLERPWVRLLTFSLLGLYGALRWGTLIPGGSTGRLLGLVALASVLAALGPVVAERSRLLAGVGAALAVAGGLALAGVPPGWILHLRVAVTARAIGEGLGTLPEINVPYTGVNDWVRLAILLGAAVLLLDSALVLTFVPRQRGYLRQAGAALPLVALCVIPVTLLRPALPYLEGVLLFALLVLFVWGDRIERHRLLGMLLPCAVVAAAALVLGPSLDRHRPWLNYRALAGGLAPGGVESFDWTQGYGPLRWPRTRRTVLEVQAARPDYWKAENLDVFDGHGWTAAAAPSAGAWEEHVSGWARRRWTQTLQVTLRSMSTSKVLAAGEAQPPTHVPGGAQRDLSPGTWQAGDRLGPGASYRVTVYAPHPTQAQLAGAGTAYPPDVTQGYLSLELPEAASRYQALSSTTGGLNLVSYTPGAGYLVRVVFPPFGAAGAGTAEAGATSAAVQGSPYAGAFAVARRLASGAATPYDYIERVEHFLSEGYRYDEHPPASAYPLESFLTVNRRGYCQHFAGAMALLLRMGGVPARVAVGFTPGSYDSSMRRWMVLDTDAHAWVEAWFPHYGWVRFDPTPTADPALGGRPATSAGRAGLRPGVPSFKARRNRLRRAASPGARAARGIGGRDTSALIMIGVPLAGAGLVLLLALLAMAGREGDPVVELARAFARAGRPLAAGVTLAALERRLSGSPEAAAYVHALRLARFSSRAQSPSLHQRRALRRALAHGLGVVGRARALWALPPRWHPPSALSRGRSLQRDPPGA